MEINSRGGGGLVRKDQSPKKKIQSKNPEGRSRLGRGPKFPHGEPRSSYVLNWGLRLQTRGDRGNGNREDLKEGFRIRMVFVWACVRKEGIWLGFVGLV